MRNYDDEGYKGKDIQMHLTIVISLSKFKDRTLNLESGWRICIILQRHIEAVGSCILEYKSSCSSSLAFFCSF